jgi:hypothetical protein
MFQGFKKGLLGGFPTMVAKSLLKNKELLGTSPEPLDPLVLSRLNDLCNQLGKEFHKFCSLPNPSHITDNISCGIRSTVESEFSNQGELGYANATLFPTVEDKETGLEKSAPYEERVLGYIRPVQDPLWPSIEDDVDYEEIRIFGPPQFDRLDLNEVYPHKDYGQTLVQPSSVIEPNKVRIITKPQVGVFTRLRSVQKRWWNFLVSHPTGFFDLVGEPLQRRHLWKIALDWSPLDKFASADYSNASDTVHFLVSFKILDCLLQDFKHKNILGEVKDLASYRNAINSMLNNEIEINRRSFPADKLMHIKDIARLRNIAHKAKTGEDDPRGQEGLEESVFDEYMEAVLNKTELKFHQENGQLMGNVLSFIILCLANYFAYHISHEKFLKRTLKLWNVPFALFNGDDTAFKTRQAHYDVWMETIKEFGFQPSAGKNYFSDKFIQLNSELYSVCTALVDYEYKVTDLYKVPFVNFGYCTFRGKQDCSQDPTRKYFKGPESEFFDLFPKFGKRKDKKYMTRRCFFKCLYSIQQDAVGRASSVCDVRKKIMDEFGHTQKSKSGIETVKSLISLRDKALDIFNFHFRFYMKLLPGLSCEWQHSAQYNKRLFTICTDTFAGIPLKPALKSELLARWPSLNLGAPKREYFNTPSAIESAQKKGKFFFEEELIDPHEEFERFQNSSRNRSMNLILDTDRQFQVFNDLRKECGMSLVESWAEIPDGECEYEIL